METIVVTESAAAHIRQIRNNKSQAREIYKGNIANSLSALAEIIHHGRDCEDIAVHTDQLLKVMNTLNDYNELFDLISNISENTEGRYVYKAEQMA